MGDTLSGRYRLDEEIGRGGMGIVFRGWDADLEREVAVKVIAADRSDTAACERLLAEARSAAALHHPHVVAVHDVGEHEGARFLVMEHIEGETLADRLERGPLPLDEALATGPGDEQVHSTIQALVVGGVAGLPVGEGVDAVLCRVFEMIGGQSAVYVEAALKAYRTGERQHPTMNLHAESLSDEDIADIAAWLESETGDAP